MMWLHRILSTSLNWRRVLAFVVDEEKLIIKFVVWIYAFVSLFSHVLLKSCSIFEHFLKNMQTRAFKFSDFPKCKKCLVYK